MRAGLAWPHEPTRRRLALRALRDSDAAFNRGDLEAAFGGLAPDVEFQLPPAFPGAQLLHGRDAVVAYYAEELPQLDGVRLWHEEVTSAGSREIACTYTLEFSGKQTGIAFKVRGLQTFEIRRGLVVRVLGDVESSRPA